MKIMTRANSNCQRLTTSGKTLILELFNWGRGGAEVVSAIQSELDSPLDCDPDNSGVVFINRKFRINFIPPVILSYLETQFYNLTARKLFGLSLSAPLYAPSG